MKYFTFEELTRSKDAEFMGYKLNIPNDEQKINLINIVEKLLDPIREELGEPIIVNSGYRNKVVNNMVGGAKNSAHLYGCAVDITLECWHNNKRLFDAIVKNGNFDKVIWERGTNYAPLWVHVELKSEKKGRNTNEKS